MPTVSDLIHSSFRLIGAIAAGEILETNELNDAFVSINQLIASWNTEGASLVGRLRVLVPVTAGGTIYQLPTFPVKIEAASVSISGIDCPLEIVDAAGWESITEKAETSVFIQKLYCDYSVPNAYVYIWPTPRMAGSLELFVFQELAQFTALTDTVEMPVGYEQALRYNFAVAILPEYPRSQVDPTLIPQAQAYKAAIQQLNISNQMRSQMGSATQSATSDAASILASR